MAQRAESADSLDDFPTPRWATRALIEHVLSGTIDTTGSCWEPTCGRGFMAATLAEYFADTRASDIHPFGYGEQFDFLQIEHDQGDYGTKLDWIITNPPFRLAEEFARRAIRMSNVGSAMLVRTGFIEGSGRYRRLFELLPPVIVAQFVERVPILKARVDPKASTATGYCWIVWRHGWSGTTELRWIPPCRKALERPGDYSDPRDPFQKPGGF